jgi:hypothetical protein
MKQYCVDLLRALEAIGLERSSQLTTLSHWPQSIEEFYRRNA